MRIFKRLLRWALILAFSGLLLAVIAVGVAYWLVAPRLPSVAVLKDYHMQVPLRVLSADGKLIASFGETRRIPVAIADVPDLLGTIAGDDTIMVITTGTTASRRIATHLLALAGTTTEEQQ